jgi:quinol monooxygenase YgiN
LSILVVERYPVDPSHISRFEALAQSRVDELRAAAGNLWADLARASDDAPSFLLLSEWRSEGDAEAAGASAAGSAAGSTAGSTDGLFDAVLRGEVTRRRFAANH